MRPVILAMAIGVVAVSAAPAPVTRQSRGEKSGHLQSWWPSGRLREDATYVRDARIGEYRTYYASGAPYERRQYVNGHEDGLQQSWTEDGTLFSVHLPDWRASTSTSVREATRTSR